MAERGGILRRPLTGEFIRDRLEEEGEDYPYRIWVALKEEREERDQSPPTYQSFYQNYIYRARELGLIEQTRTEAGFGRYDRQFYRIVPGEEDSPCWRHIQVCYDPLTQLGREDYRDLRAEAEGRDVSLEDLFIEENYDRIEEVAGELGVNPGKVEERVRRSRPFRRLQK